MTAEAMWHQYCVQNGIDEKTAYEEWPFCGGGPAADELAGLVLAGKKTATSSTCLAFETAHEAIPQVGSYSVILYDNGEAACIIRDTKVTLMPFDQVPKEHAYKEGEDDRSLEMWREVHVRAFTPDFEAVGKAFDEKAVCVLEEFEVVYLS